MNSKIYIGSLEHQRYKPIRHDLSYPLYVYAFDLKELSHLNQRFPLFGYNRLGITTIQDKDYLEPNGLSIKQKVLQLLSNQDIKEHVETIIMVTSARYFNYVFNPVSFHFCFSHNQKLIAVVAEVNNTYGERHPYVLTENLGNESGWFASFRTPKVFHVSPFNKIEGMYHFYFSDPRKALFARIDLISNDTKIMSATLEADGLPFTMANHIKTMARYPAAPHLSVPRIYAHAFKLFFQKKLTFNTKPVPMNAITQKKQTPSILESICMRLVFSLLKKIKTGHLTVELPNQKQISFGDPNHPKKELLQIKDFHFFPRLVFDGEIGLGEAFMHAEWETPDLVSLMTLLIENRDHFSDGNLALSILTRLKEKLAHDKRKNTIENTPDNIAEHYDLSNEFYDIFLDKNMLYSCGIFNTPEDSLELAQKNKMDRILSQAEISSDHHMLEIGCGWGGFTVYAVKKIGCRVTGITVSKAQYERACQRVKKEGLGDKITILLQDYRHTSGSFDRIVSIEMIEAVGPQYYSTYFRQAQHLLKKGGKFIFQAITIIDDRYDQYCRERDWIQKHIFPGGHLPSLGILKKTIHESTEFELEDVFHMGLDYSTTLSLWQERFLSNLKHVKKLGFDDIFIRKWIYYFSLCEAGFESRGIDDIQVTLAG